ncbi:MAG: HisA/HisF-related TIM barrel protein [Lentisphaeria bacterium]|nr:HisA/HisF-related TIM barrel protein [Lentisphaeria bacterium]
MHVIYPYPIPKVLLSAGQVVVTRKFANPKPVCSPEEAIDLFNTNPCEQLILMDLDAIDGERDIDGFEIFADKANMPLVYGGAIHSQNEIDQFLVRGADKILISSQITNSLEFLEEALQNFGAGRIMACIDVQGHFFGGHKIHDKRGKKNTGTAIKDFLPELYSLGIKEVLIQNVAHDGMRNGFDIKLLTTLAEVEQHPSLIISSGLVKPEDFRKLVDIMPAARTAASSFFFQDKKLMPELKFPEEPIFKTTGSTTSFNSTAINIKS